MSSTSEDEVDDKDEKKEEEMEMEITGDSKSDDNWEHYSDFFQSSDITDSDWM